MARRDRLQNLAADQAVAYLADELDDMEREMTARFDKLDTGLAALAAKQEEWFRTTSNRALAQMGGLAVACLLLVANLVTGA